MNDARRWFDLSLAIAALCGCGVNPSSEDLAWVSQAVNACNESVPANRFVDGLPAYAQCSGVSSGNIWSNNGIDTSTTSAGADWIQTQRGGGYQCTEWAYRYMHFRWNVNYRSGDAKQWCSGTLPSNLVKATTPVHGDLIVFDAGVCGADSTTGHVAVVDTVNASAASVTIVEENQAGRRNTKQTCALCFLHAVANDGSGAGAGGTSGGNGAGGSGTAGASSGGAAAGGNGATGSGGRMSAGGSNSAGPVTQDGGATQSGGATQNGGARASGGAAQNGGAPPRGGTAGGGAGGGGALQNGGSTAGGAAAGGALQNGGAAGAPISAGATPSSGGATASSGSATNDVRPHEVQGSCSCSVPGARSRLDSSSWASALWLAAGLVLRRKRRCTSARGAGEH